MTGAVTAAGGFLLVGLALLALTLFLVAIRVGRWSIWLAAYLVAALTVAAGFLRAPAIDGSRGPAPQRSDASGVLRWVESPAGIDPRRSDTITEEGQRVDPAILDPGGKPS